MVMTTILAECGSCEREVEAKILDCDDCFEGYLEQGGDPEKYNDLICQHLQCLECGERF